MQVSRRSHRVVDRAVRALIESVESRQMLSISPDPTFAGDGVVHYANPLGNAYIRSAGVVDNQQRVVTVSEIDFVEPEFDVRRFNTDGSPDGTFGTGGLQTVTVPFAVDEVVSITDVAIAPDNGVFVAGLTFGAINEGFVFRINPDGTFDDEFNAVGLYRLSPTPGGVEELKLDVVGNDLLLTYESLGAGGLTDFLGVTKLDAAGIPVLAFGLDGTTIVDITGEQAAVSGSVIVGNDLFVGGSTDLDPSPAQTDAGVFVVKLNATNAEVDFDFGISGFKTIQAPSDTFEAIDFAAAPGGGFYFAGNTLNASPFQYTATYIKATAAFTPDTSFGSTGSVTVPLADNLEIDFGSLGESLLVNADGSLLSAVNVAVDRNAGLFDIGVLKLNADGSRNTDFAPAGLFTLDQASAEIVNTLVRDADGRLIVSGVDVAGGVLARLGSAAVVNTAPTASGLTGPGSVLIGSSASFNATIADADAGDTLEVSWDFGDGTITPFASAAAGAVSASHTYANTGAYNVTLTVRDAAGDSGSATTSITASAVVFSGGALSVVGSLGNDNVRVVSSANGTVSVVRNGTSTPLAGVPSRIVLTGGSGTDVLYVSLNLNIPSTLIGGEGSDILISGNGDDLLVGGTGADVLVGAGGRDVIIGGDGSDMLYGVAGEDLLIAGFTSYDNDPVALAQVQAEWGSTRNFNTRVSNLRGINPTADRLNGTTYLLAGVNVFNDNDSDFLNGGAANDWYFANTTGPGADFVLDTNSSLVQLVLNLLGG
jgi:PKD repeat protein